MKENENTYKQIKEFEEIYNIFLRDLKGLKNDN